MDYFFQGLQDISLRRIYKFVLKRTLGKYLKDELLLEQLEVDSRDGNVKLSNLNINEDLINEELSGIPIKISSIQVNEIQVKISYSALVKDSFFFQVDTLQIVLEPNSKWSSNIPENSSSSSNPNCIVQEQSGETISDEGQEGLSFIAQWIEVIIAKLKVSIKNINISIAIPSYQSKIDKSRLVFQFSDINYFNSDPSFFRIDQSNLDLSASILNGSDINSKSLIGTKKLLTINSFAINLEGEDSLTLIELLNQIQIKLNVDSTNMDFDILIPKLSIEIDFEKLSSLFTFFETLVNLLSKFGDQNKISDLLTKSAINLEKILAQRDQDAILSWLENEYSSRKDITNDSDGVDYLQLLSSIRRVRKNNQIDKQVNQLNLADSDSIIESDGEFPSSDDDSDDLGDTQFFDAHGDATKNIPSNLNRSLYQSIYPTEKKDISSLKNSRNNRQSLQKDDSNQTRIRLHVIDFHLFVSDLQRKHQLVLEGTDAILNCNVEKPTQSKESKISLDLTLSTLKLFELDIEKKHKTILLNFHTFLDSKTIFSFPNIEIKMNSFPQENSVNENNSPQNLLIQCSLAPVVFSTSISRMNKWVEFFAKLSTLEFNKSSTQSPFSFELKIPKIEVFLHSDEKILESTWSSINEALRLDSYSKPWYSFLIPSKDYLIPHFDNINGGLSISINDLNITYQANTSDYFTDQNIEMNEIEVGIFLKKFSLEKSLTPFIWHTNLIKACCDGEKKYKVRLKKQNVKSFGETPLTKDEEYDYLDDLEGYNEDDMGPSPPFVDKSRIFHISAYKLELDIQQREYNALMIIAETLVYHDKNSLRADGNSNELINSSSNSPNSSFGLIVTTNFAELTISENNYRLLEIILGKRSTEFGNQYRISQLCEMILQLRSATNTSPQAQILNDSLKVCISIRNPRFDLYSIEYQLFVGLKANDLSIFEMSYEEFNYLKKSGFNFNQACQPIARVGKDKYKIPFVHRAYSWRKSSDIPANKASTFFSDHSYFGHAFEIRLALTHDEQQFKQLEGVKQIHFFIDFYDIHLSHDPASTWLLKLVNILTPKTVDQSISDLIDEALVILETFQDHFNTSQRLLYDQYLTNQLEAFNDIPQTQSNDSIDLESNKFIHIPFEVTKMSVRIRESLVDYSCDLHSSRTILSVGLLALSSTIVSNSPRFSLKISLNRLSFHVNNKLNTENFTLNLQDNTQSKDDSHWLENFGFVQILDIDYLTNLVTINETDKEELSLTFNFGTCLLHGCIDSLDLLFKTCKVWFDDFQISCAQSDKILKKKPKSYSPLSKFQLSIENYEIERVRICDSIETFDPQAIDPQVSFLNESQQSVQNKIVPDNLLNLSYHYKGDPILTNQTQNKNHNSKNSDVEIYSKVLENYYDSSQNISNRPTFENSSGILNHSSYENDDEQSARWLPDYDYHESELPNYGLFGQDIFIQDTPSGVSQYLVQNAFDFGEENDGVIDKEENLSLIDELSVSGDQDSEIESVILDDDSTPSELLNTEKVWKSNFGLPEIFGYSNAHEIKPKELEEVELDNLMSKKPMIHPSESMESNILIDEDVEYYKKLYENEFQQTYGSISQNNKDQGNENIIDGNKGSFDILESLQVETSNKLPIVSFTNIPILEPTKELATGNMTPILESKKVLSAIEPGLTNNQKREIENVDLAWKETNPEREEIAKWYNSNGEPKILPHYIPIIATTIEDEDHRTKNEKLLKTNLFLKLSGNVKMKLYSGLEWEVPISKDTDSKDSSKIDSKKNAAHSSNKTVKFQEGEKKNPANTSKDYQISKNYTSKIQEKETKKPRPSVDILGKHLIVQVSIYGFQPEELVNRKKNFILPKERITITINELLISYGLTNEIRRRKVLGSWISSSKPRDTSQPMFKLVLLGYNDTNLPDNLEYRLNINILPLRCYLNEEFTDFVRSIVLLSNKSQTNTTSSDLVEKNDSKTPFFQQISISAIEIKIDYQASHINLKALREGDYLQLLNILPIQGLELTLKSIKLLGVDNMALYGNKILETWVKDIYANQLHRVISGAAPLKGISKIGSEIQGLLYLPRSDFRKTNSMQTNSQNVIKHLHKGTKNLVSTIAKETLDISHKLSLFVAQTITDLTADTTSEHSSSQKKQSTPKIVSKQPRDLQEGLQQAYQAVSREFKEAAETVIAVPVRQYERLGPSGLVTSVLRALPIAVLKPVAGIAEGLSYTILGVRNNLDPESKMDEEDLWNVDNLDPNK